MLSTETHAAKVTRGAKRDWRQRYSSRLALTDFLAIVWVVFGVQIAWLDWDQTAVGGGGNQGVTGVSYTLISLAIVVGWMVALKIHGSRSDRVIGHGAAEYKLVLNAGIRLFGLVAIIAFLLKVDLARGYILMALPIGTLVLLASRWMWRQWLGVQRQRGEFSSTVLLVGSEESVAHISRQLRSQPSAGYRVLGACTPRGGSTSELLDAGVEVVGTVASIGSALDRTGADTVIVTSSDELSPARLRELSWSLEPGRQHLVVAPSLTDVSGPRIHTRPVAGLPLIHIETPQYEGTKLFTKRVFDLVVSGLFLVLLSPLFAVLALLVKLSSRGPVFYRQERVGLRGERFQMLKFRSMSANADDELRALLEQQGTEDKPLFKIENDPRVTAIGRVLRKYSLDEFPQLVNVLVGDMSLVGPRPQREGEVALYDDAAHRRLLLKPGMSGLWQVSGRSNLSWEDAIRLDLYYVENWSMVGDIGILWRTIGAVLWPKGAF